MFEHLDIVMLFMLATLAYKQYLSNLARNQVEDRLNELKDTNEIYPELQLNQSGIYKNISELLIKIKERAIHGQKINLLTIGYLFLLLLILTFSKHFELELDINSLTTNSYLLSFIKIFLYILYPGIGFILSFTNIVLGLKTLHLRRLVDNEFKNLDDVIKISKFNQAN